MNFLRRLFSREPVISCLAVTRNRVAMLEVAVECFRRQTFKRAELIIVHDYDDEATARYGDSIKSATIRVVQAPPGLKLGALRNLAVASARGRYIAQWDDDDWHAPNRLRLQLKRLKQTGKPACVLRRWTVYDAWTDRAFFAPPRTWEGSILAERAVLPAYDPSLARREDTPVVEALAARDQLALLDRPKLYVYVYHGSNTFDRPHWELIFRKGKQLSPEKTALIRSRLSPAVMATPSPPLREPADPRARTSP